MNILDSEKGSAEIVGNTILFGLTITGMGMITLFSVSMINGLQDTVNIKNAEQIFDLFDSRATGAILGDLAVQTVDINLAGGTLIVEPDDTNPSYITVSRGAPTDWYNASWTYRKSITIDYTKVSGNQTSFPVLISITDANLSSSAQSDGNDILFTSSDGTTRLAHEIENFNKSTGLLIAWVNVPQLSSTINTTLYMYYNSSDTTSHQNVSGVWDNNYIGVWHLKETGSGNPGEYRDSTSNNNQGQGGGGVPTRVAGKIGYAQDFDNVCNYISVPNSTSLQPVSALTIEGWIRPRTFGAGYVVNMILRKGDINPNNYQLAIENGKAALYLDGNDSAGFHGPSTLLANTWYYVVGTWDGSTETTYIDGNPDGSASRTGTIGTDTRPVFIGGRIDCTDISDGIVDEVRLSSVGRTSNWIETEYNNQNSPNTFYSVGSQQAYTFKIPMGKVKYSLGDRIIAYEGGGVWLKYPSSGSAMLSPPKFSYNGVTLTIPGINIRGNSSAAGRGFASVSFKKAGTLVLYPDASISNRTNPVYGSSGDIYVNVTSDFYDAWAEYARGLGYTSVSTNSTTRTTSIRLSSVSTTLAGKTPIFNPFRLRGIDPGETSPMEDFSFWLVPYGNKFDWDIHASSGKKKLIFHINGKADDPGDKIDINVGYQDTVAGYIKPAETWKGLEKLTLLGQEGNLFLDLNLLNTSVNLTYDDKTVGAGSMRIHSNSFNTTGFSWGQPTLTNKSLFDITQHYLGKMAEDGDISFYQGYSPGKQPAAESTMLINYSLTRAPIYLYVSQNNADVSIDI